MKKHVFVFAGLFLMSLFGFGQGSANLVIFSEDGDLFFAYINGIRQNDKPEANVKITGLTFPNVSLRIEFNDKALPQLKQNMVLEPGQEHTAKIVRDLKKQVKLRYFGQAPIDNSAQQSNGAVVYHHAENPVANEGTYNTAGTTVTSSTTSTQTYNNANGGNTSVNVNMGGVGISMNVNGMDPNSNGNTMTTTSSTTVTSSSSSSNYNNGTTNNNGASATSNAGCSGAMSAGSFAKMKQSVESKPFSETKMSTAKVATKNACLSVSQVKEICKLFSMDEDKLAYAKYAYDHTVDKANYYQVSEVFSFSSSTEELNNYLEQH